MRGTILKLTRAQVVQRALREATHTLNGYPIGYQLKDYNGGTDPNAPHCATYNPDRGKFTADCIGFALYASGIDRKQPGYKGSLGEWLNCSSLLADAHGAMKFCRPLMSGEAAYAGDWLVTRTHIGVIIRPARSKGYKHLVMDCSPRHGRETGIGMGYPWSTECEVLRPLFYAEP